jgi:hypothetical protein
MATEADRRKWRRYIRERVEVCQETGCWLWKRSTSLNGGYGFAGVVAPCGGRAHRLAYIAFIGAIPDGLQVRHQCHTPRCCNPKHLLVGNHQDNVDDNKRDGRKLGSSILNAEQVAEIRTLLAAGHLQREIGAKYGVQRVTITDIAARRTWAHVA